MKDELRRYYPIKGSEGERNGHKTKRMVKCKLSYQLGGINWATSKPEARGYYAHVYPVEIEDLSNDGGGLMESYGAFSGGKWLLVECSRQSQKKEAEAAKLFEEKLKEMVLQLFAQSPDKDNIDFEHPEK